FFRGYFVRPRFDSTVDKEYVFAQHTSPVCECFMVFALISIDDRTTVNIIGGSYTEDIKEKCGDIASFVPDDSLERYLSELSCARTRFLFQHIRYPKPNVTA
ncbi:hypothetical protein ALC57_06602, partial [Trachymyrmex cornetzi]